MQEKCGKCGNGGNGGNGVTRTETGETELGSLKVTFSRFATLLKLIHTRYTTIHIYTYYTYNTNTQINKHRRDVTRLIESHHLFIPDLVWCNILNVELFLAEVQHCTITGSVPGAAHNVETEIGPEAEVLYFTFTRSISDFQQHYLALRTQEFKLF